MPLLPYNIHYKIDSSPESSNHSNSFYIKENEHQIPPTSNHLNSQLVNKQNSKKLFSHKLQQNNHPNNNTSSPSTSSFNSFTINSPFSSISENKNRLTLPIKQLVNSQTKITNSFPLISESPDSAFGDSVDITPTNNNFMNWTELFDYLRKEIVTYIFNFKTSI